MALQKILPSIAFNASTAKTVVKYAVAIGLVAVGIAGILSALNGPKTPETDMGLAFLPQIKGLNRKLGCSFEEGACFKVTADQSKKILDPNAPLFQSTYPNKCDLLNKNAAFVKPSKSVESTSNGTISINNQTISFDNQTYSS